MRLSKDLIDKPVVAMSDGRIIGTVKDIYLTPDLDALAGIHLGKEGFLRRKSLLIPAAAVAVFGIDVVLVQHSDVLSDDHQLKDAASWVRLDKLQGREVDTPGGTKVGVIGDVALDEAGRVSGFALSRVYVSGPIAEQRVVYRTAVIDNGNADGVMTIDIARAEKPSAAPTAEPLPSTAPVNVSSNVQDAPPPTASPEKESGEA